MEVREPAGQWPWPGRARSEDRSDGSATAFWSPARGAPGGQGREAPPRGQGLRCGPRGAGSMRWSGRSITLAGGLDPVPANSPSAPFGRLDDVS